MKCLRICVIRWFYLWNHLSYCFFRENVIQEINNYYLYRFVFIINKNLLVSTSLSLYFVCNITKKERIRLCNLLFLFLKTFDLLLFLEFMWYRECNFYFYSSVLSLQYKMYLSYQLDRHTRLFIRLSLFIYSLILLYVL